MTNTRKGKFARRSENAWNVVRNGKPFTGNSNMGRPLFSLAGVPIAFFAQDVAASLAAELGASVVSI
jgi:hypothetical protein|tara:strand:+ start:948 stop:1148 length:201 start_codon:yes stop_codon:yes gene_type:complete